PPQSAVWSRRRHWKQPTRDDRRRASEIRRRSRQWRRVDRDAATRRGRRGSAQPRRFRPRYRRRRAHTHPLRGRRRSRACLRRALPSSGSSSPRERFTMQIRLAHDAPQGVRTEALVVPFFEGDSIDGATKVIDDLAGSAVAAALAAGEVKGKFGETVLAYANDRPFRRVLAVGLGKASK